MTFSITDVCLLCCVLMITNTNPCPARIPLLTPMLTRTGASSAYLAFKWRVTDVHDTRSATLELVEPRVDVDERASGGLDRFITSIKQANSSGSSSASYTLKKQKQSRTLSHQPLSTRMLSPSFNSCNGCMSDRQNTAVSRLLWAWFLVQDDPTLRERLRTGTHVDNTYGLPSSSDGSTSGTGTGTGSSSKTPSGSTDTRRPLRTYLLSQLLQLEVEWPSQEAKGPLAPLKHGGLGGELLDDMVDKLLPLTDTTHRGDGRDNRESTSDVVGPVMGSDIQCPIASSCIGPLAAQEVIKVCEFVFLKAIFIISSYIHINTEPQTSSIIAYNRPYREYTCPWTR